MPYQSVLLPATVFASVTIGLLAAFWYFMRRERRAEQRITNLVSDQADPNADPSRSAVLQLLHGTLPKLGERLVPDGDKERARIKSRLAHAGFYSHTAITLYALTKFVLMLLFPVLVLAAWLLGFLEFAPAVMFAGLAGCVGMIAPSWWLERRKKARHAMFRRSLPDYLDLLVACVEGGMSLQSGLQRVADELRLAHPVLAAEMEIVQREGELGSTLANSFMHLAERTDLDSFRSLARFIQQSQRFGTTLGEALREHAEMLRTQREQIAEEAAQKAVVKILIPTMLFIFPSIFIVLAGPAAIKLQETFANSKGDSSSLGK